MGIVTNSRHAAAAAGGAEAAPLAGEGHEAVVAAVVAAQAQKAVGENATAQQGAQFLLDEAEHGMPAFGRAGQGVLELLANRPVEEGLLGAGGFPGYPESHVPRSPVPERVAFRALDLGSVRNPRDTRKRLIEPESRSELLGGSVGDGVIMTADEAPETGEPLH
jgi:hypothetical protein